MDGRGVSVPVCHWSVDGGQGERSSAPFDLQCSRVARYTGQAGAQGVPGGGRTRRDPRERRERRQEGRGRSEG